MSLFDAPRYRSGPSCAREAHARDLNEEIDFHLSLEAKDRSTGATVARRRPAARRRFGNVTHYSEETRAMSGQFFDMLRQDARFALRTFRHAPGSPPSPSDHRARTSAPRRRSSASSTR